MRNAARFMSALLIATLLLPSLLAGPAAASGLTTHFAITGLADPIVAGAPDSITVNALDAGDGIDTTFTGTVSFTSSDGSAQLPADGQSLTNGTGTFQVEFRTSGSQSVTVTEDGDTPTGSANTTVDAAALDHLVLSPPNSSKAPGVAQAYTAEGFDQFDNSLGDATGATTFTVATGTCTLADCSSTVAGAHTVTGTDGTATGTATLTVTAGALNHLVLSPATATKAPGVSQAYTAEGRDAFENTLGDVTGAT
ncbi:MAG: hypothetical protein ACXWB2_18480, partial [Acidimicrobiales bacterium]